MSSVTVAPSRQARFGLGTAAGEYGPYPPWGRLIVNLLLYALAHVAFGVPAKFQPLASPFFVAAYTVFGTLPATAMLRRSSGFSRQSPGVFRCQVAAAVFFISLTALLLGPAGSLPVVLVAGVGAAVLAFSLVGNVATPPLAAFQLVVGAVTFVMRRLRRQGTT
jgi:hypothetical protein